MAKPRIKFARPTTAAVTEKQTNVMKTMVGDTLKADATTFWKRHGYPSESDFLREVLMVTVYGSEFVTDLHAQRIAALVRSEAGIGTKG